MTTKIASVFGGHNCSLVISNDGYLFGWGDLSFIGVDMSTGQSYRPIQLGTRKYKMVSVGHKYIMAIDINNILYGWGNNNTNQLGSFGTIKGDFKNDLIETSNLRWKFVCCGYMHTVAITLDGDIYTFGNNNNGQIGNNSIEPINIPYKIDRKDNNSPWIKAVCSMYYTIALNEAGQLYAWGRGGGTLSYITIGNILIPTKINNINGQWKDIITASYTILAINEKNEVYGSGLIQFGTLGNGPNMSNLNYQKELILIENVNGSNIKKFNSNYNTQHFLAVYNDNSLYSWGSNEKGQLGLGDTTNRFIPTKINIPTSIKWIDAFECQYHSIALDIDGNVYTCGGNSMGQLGIGNTDNNIHNTFEKIVIPSTIFAPGDKIPAPVDNNTTPPPVDNNTTPPPVDNNTKPPPVDNNTTPPPVDNNTKPPPVDNNTKPPPVDNNTTPPPVPTSRSIINTNKKKIMIAISDILSILVVMLLVFLFYKLTIKYT
jgi:alpha-tubulin suppressor-like RCC1 family protein